MDNIEEAKLDGFIRDNLVSSTANLALSEEKASELFQGILGKVRQEEQA